jgi:hypothetical protein
VTISAVAGQRIRTLRTRGLRLRVTASESCRIDLAILIDRTTARRLKIDRKAHGNVTVGSGKPSVKAGTKVIAIRLTAKTRRALRHTTRITFSLRATARDAAGNTAKVSSPKIAIKHR